MSVFKLLYVWVEGDDDERDNGLMDSDQNGSQFKVYLLTI